VTLEAPTLVLGAGLAGLTVAAKLARAGEQVVVLEKSRGLGGRLATRRADGLRFDHGAPYLDAADPALAGPVAAAREAGLAADWPEGGAGAVVGLPGMSALLRPLAAGVEVVHGLEAAHAERQGSGWVVRDGDGAVIARGARLVSTIPAPQAQLVLAARTLADGLGGVAFAPCWTLMAAFEAPLPLPDAARTPDAPLVWAARESAKPGRADAPEAWVAQAGAAWSRETLEMDREEAAQALLALLAERAGTTLPAPVHAAAHRWRYARAEVPLGAGCLADPAARLVIAGDWCLGASAGDAARSAQAALVALAGMR